MKCLQSFGASQLFDDSPDPTLRYAAEKEWREFCGVFLAALTMHKVLFQRLGEFLSWIDGFAGNVSRQRSRLLRIALSIRLDIFLMDHGLSALDLPENDPAWTRWRSLVREVDQAMQESLHSLGVASQYEWLENMRDKFRERGRPLPWWLGPSLNRALELHELQMETPGSNKLDVKQSE